MTATRRFSGLVLAAWLVLGHPGAHGAIQPPPSGVDRQPAEPSSPPSPTAGDREDAAVLRFRVVDAGTAAVIPARLTFIGKEGPGAKLFPNAGASPNRLAVRSNVIYTLSGQGAVTVPPGQYTIYASRGPEWSVDQRRIELKAGGRADFTAELRHEVDTTGWISGDFHLHTLTHSGHGDSNMKERVITFLGEGLEFAVATDHNHHTDYRPTMRELGIEKGLTTVTGNEVSVPIGHFNAFPLDPDRPAPPKDSRDARKLFKLIRAEPNEFGIVPVIQLNHPRWSSIDYFGKSKLDPITGIAHAEVYSDDFDTIEVFNENEGWGYFDAETTTEFSIGSSRHSVLRDWFNLLNRGHRYAAVGNSDSHAVYSCLAGYPRNYVPSRTDEAGKIDPREVAATLRNRRSFTTLGPFVEFGVNGQPMGSDVKAKNGLVKLNIRIQAASWVDCDRVKIVVNGDVVEELPVPDTRRVVRFEKKHPLRLASDAWVALLVEGDDSLAPIVHDQSRPIRPFAVTNPVWVDADGDGRWTAPRAQAEAIVRGASEVGAIDAAWSAARPAMRGLIVLAAAEQGHAGAGALIRAALCDKDRTVRLAAARAAETAADAGLTSNLVEQCKAASTDAYLGVALLRAAAHCAPDRKHELALAYLDRHAADRVKRYRAELDPLLPGDYVRLWRVAGYFPNPGTETLVKVAYGPEKADSRDGPFKGKNDAQVTWKRMSAGRNGYLDLRRIDNRRGRYNKAIAYAETHLHSDRARSVRFAAGSDDGCRLWVNGKLLIDDNVRHGANPFQHMARMMLQEGWNRVLVKVENGRGAFGLYLRILDDRVRSADVPPTVPATNSGG